MKAELTDNIPIISGSANGVQLLRNLILQLAVRGRLVPQDPKEKTAISLVRGMVALQKQLLADGKIRKVKEDDHSVISNVDSNVPSSWAVAKVGDLLTVVRGASPRPKGDPRFFSIQRTPFHWVKISDLRKHGKNGVLLDTDEFLTADGAQRSVLAPKGTLVITNSATIGVPIMMGIDGYIHDGFLAFPFFPHQYLDQSFFLVVLKALTPHLVSEARGLAQLNMNSGIMRNARVSIPPLEEQRRIVTRVNELIALCDCLENHQMDSDTAHSVLVKTFLGALVQAQDQSDFVSRWNLVNQNFDVLFTSESSVNALKQCLVQLAVMGKLSTQKAADDESASLVMERIRNRKKKLSSSGKLPKEKQISPITEREIPYRLPPGWVWARIGDLALRTDYGISEKTFEMDEGLPVLKMGDIQEGRVILGRHKKTSELVPEELLLLHNDLLYNRTNSAELVGKTGLFDGPANEYTFASYLIRIRVPDDLVLPQYLNLAMNSPAFRETQINPQLKQQCGQANVNGTVMRNMLVPLPPTNEQRRIVDQTARLLLMCDELASRLKEASSLSLTLSEALISACSEEVNRGFDFDLVSTSSSNKRLEQEQVSV